MGQGLIHHLKARSDVNILALDLKPLAPELKRLCGATIVGDILDKRLLERLVSEFEIHAIYHLAALLSTRAEFTPESAHEVNVQGTLNLLKLATEQSQWHGQRVRFMFPSSIAVYGLPDLETKRTARAAREYEYLVPTTMYGCNKLYCEHLGRYYAHYYRQLAAKESPSGSVDFRCIRFPGLISAFTTPHGGTSDYGPEMIHAAAQSLPYPCFVRADTEIPFMAMPDAIQAIADIMSAARDRLRLNAYNVRAFHITAEKFRERIREAFPDAAISFRPDLQRQAIVDTWPGDVDVTAACEDWGFSPRFDESRTFDEYLVPTIRKRYRPDADR